MIEDLLGGCFETFGHWFLGALFLIATMVVLIGIPSSENTLFSCLLAILLLHTSALLIVGFGFKKAKRFLGISWAVVLALFIIVAVFAASA